MRTLLCTLALLAVVAAGATLPATADAYIAGKRCQVTASVKYCAFVRKNPGRYYQPEVRIRDRTGTRGVKVRVRASTLHRSVNGVWRVKGSLSTPQTRFQPTLHVHGHGNYCRNWRTSAYRISGTVQWRANGNLYREGIRSGVVRLKRC
jgi:hypothetical protein